MSSVGAALGAAFLSSARAEASRINGARSRGPRTPEGKARSVQNALKHGFRAEKFVVVGDEDEADYEAHEQALLAELAPDGTLQTLLAERIARAAWRLLRAERIEAELFDLHAGTDNDLGLALIRDGHGTRAFDTLLRYRASADAQLWRALRTLKALQAEAAARPQEMRAIAPAPIALEPMAHAARENPIEPEAGGDRVESAPAPATAKPACPPVGPRVRPNKPARAPARRLPPNEPDPAARATQASGQRITAIEAPAPALSGYGASPHDAPGRISSTSTILPPSIAQCE